MTDIALKEQAGVKNGDFVFCNDGVRKGIRTPDGGDFKDDRYKKQAKAEILKKLTVQRKLLRSRIRKHRKAYTDLHDARVRVKRWPSLQLTTSDSAVFQLSGAAKFAGAIF
ncbi:MAG TPA: hypothetical protein VKR81_04955 [Candidatus Binatia bacterium]|nr:hypothetical protein [Candidatus Binatia bacterium]